MDNYFNYLQLLSHCLIYYCILSLDLTAKSKYMLGLLSLLLVNQYIWSNWFVQSLEKRFGHEVVPETLSSFDLSARSRNRCFWSINGLWLCAVYWKVALYTNGSGTGEGRYVSIYLYSIDCKSYADHEKMRADISMCIKNKIHDKHQTGKFNDWFSYSRYSVGYTN